jgi:hypothetical protein
MAKSHNEVGGFRLSDEWLFGTAFHTEGCDFGLSNEQ